MGDVIRFRWVVPAALAVMLTIFFAACTTTETVEVAGETVVVEKEVVKEIQVPGETVVVQEEVVKIVELRQQYVTDPTTGKTVSAPQYGGTLNIRQSGSAPSVDPWIDFHAGQILDGVSERMGISDWGYPRADYNQMAGEPPMAAIRGELAESWEIIDDLTTVYHIRDDVYWHDKAPMNGRKFTAEDMEYSWHRLLGIGDKYGFTEGPSSSGILKDMPIESITATDENTLVWKLSEPFFDAQRQILVNYAFWTQPREVIEEHGDYTDWKTIVGTGPWAIADMVRDSYVSYSKNPSYWGFDEKYPDNRLPYFDEVKALDIPEVETKLASLRTGKLDGLVGMDRIDIDPAQQLAKSNPEVEMWGYSFRSYNGYNLNTKKPPFDDVRVRHAMQMALDYKGLNRNLYGGLGIEGPMGVIGEGAGAIFTPYDEWPAELLGYYTYNPEGAEALLDQAGYPRDPNTGIRFETKYNTKEPADTNYIAIDHWADIGVQVTIETHDGPTMIALRQNAEYEGIATGHMGVNYNPMMALYVLASSEGAWNEPGYNDAEYDELVANMNAAKTKQEQADWGKKASMKLTWMHGSLWFTKVPAFAVAQPWLIGYDGEYTLGPTYDEGTLISRLWMNRNLKSSMGY